MSQRLSVILIGPTGRLGGAIGRALRLAEDIDLAGGVVRAGSEADGADLGQVLGGEACGVTCGGDLAAMLDGVDVVIDASVPAMSVEAAQTLARRGGPGFVTGVTGFSDDQEAALREAAGAIAVLKAGNFSLGVAMVERLVKQAAALPAEGWDIEVEETHHRRKADAPSGTALMLGRAAAAGRAVTLEDEAVWSREGQTGARETGRIGFAVSRGGGVVGEHRVRFLAELEEIAISHRAFDRSVFAAGAVEAARWIAADRPAGLYDMQDVVAGQ